MGGENFSLLLKSLFPTLFGLWWYPTTYIVFLFLWPFYHRGLSALNDDDLKRCITAMFIFWSASTVIPYVDLGTSNLCAFFMLYAIVIFVKRKDIAFVNYKGQCISLIIFPYLVAILSIIVLDMLGIKIGAAATYSCYYLRGNFRPVSMMVSVGLFIWAISWKIKYCKWINCIADATFGVYLIHMYPTVMKFLFSDVFNLKKVIDKNYCVLYLLYGVIVIFVGGVIIDKLREGIFYFVGKLKNSRLTSKNGLGSMK